jgi:hypothetical protein
VKTIAETTAGTETPAIPLKRAYALLVAEMIRADLPAPEGISIATNYRDALTVDLASPNDLLIWVGNLGAPEPSDRMTTDSTYRHMTTTIKWNGYNLYLSYGGHVEPPADDELLGLADEMVDATAPKSEPQDVPCTCGHLRNSHIDGLHNCEAEVELRGSDPRSCSCWTFDAVAPAEVTR